MGISVDTWRKTRIEEAEASGVAKAINQFEKAWPKGKLSNLPLEDADPAFEAIGLLRKALGTAEEKCKKAAKADAKKRTQTLDLIGGWLEELKAYENSLQVAYGKALTTAIARKVFETMERVAPNSLQEIKEKADNFASALQKADLALAYKYQTDLSKSVRVLGAQLSPKGVKEQIGYACQDLKLDVNVSNVDVKSCTPKQLPDWKKQLGQLEKRLEELESGLDELESRDHGADPESAAGSPEYKKNLKLVIADYSGVIGACQDAQAELIEVQKRFEKLQGMAPQVRSTNPEVFKKTVLKMREIVDKQETQMKREVEKIRTKDGEFVKKKNNFGITDGDTNKFLAPILNKMFSKNLRAIKLIVTLRQGLDELEEG